jgi:hypothetical protein
MYIQKHRNEDMFKCPQYNAVHSNDLALSAASEPRENPFQSPALSSPFHLSEEPPVTDK